MVTTLSNDSTSPRLSLPAREEISSYLLMDEYRLVGSLIERAVFSEEDRQRVSEMARRLVHTVRNNRTQQSGIDTFMHEYGLATEEGIILMCIAEALLRIPDAETAENFIADRLAEGDWQKHLGHSDSLFVNASTWGLLLSGRLMKIRGAEGENAIQAIKRLAARSGDATIRMAVKHAVRLLGDQFVLGRDITTALERAEPLQASGYRFSFDMLGEAAQCEADAERYFQRYMTAVDAVAGRLSSVALKHADEVFARPSISVKLTALHPRVQAGKERRLNSELFPRLLTLARACREQGLGLTIDAEEQDRLDLTLEMFGKLAVHPTLSGWHGLGIAVQAYGKRAIAALRWLMRVSDIANRRIPVRLVKGAYWDSEIKWAQERGLEDYPVFTRKLHSDVSYLAAMRLMLAHPRAFYSQFATHNAHTIASAHVIGGERAFELQRLHGMGEPLYAELRKLEKFSHPCRIYAPVGGHEELLGYLVRRLLENGANTSFVNRLSDEETPVSEIVADPVQKAEIERSTGARPVLMVKPRDLFQPSRTAGAGLALFDLGHRLPLVSEIKKYTTEFHSCGSIIDGELQNDGAARLDLTAPHDRREHIGTVAMASGELVDRAIRVAEGTFAEWHKTPVERRAQILRDASELFEKNRARLIALLVREAGKTIEDALLEVREAVDFLRYYAGEAERLFSTDVSMPGPTGETNILGWRARGVFGCISPWNFPLAIFTGQIAAALVAGNTVVAKPAEQTPITASVVVKFLHQAGIPAGALNLVMGDGDIGHRIVSDRRVDGIVFTGSIDAAWSIQRALCDRRAAIVPFIAESGGINAMIADSSALPEQVVRDAIRSAFGSAGQRCSAARVIFVQSDAATRLRHMLAGAVECLDVGHPLEYSTDIGPVIDARAQDMLEIHKVRMQREGRELIDVAMPEACRTGTYVTPALYEIESFDQLQHETFGPILHFITFERGHLDHVIDAINAKGFGLTLGLHSRIARVADRVAERARVGNLYVNRSQIGSVVGVQPFGGEGLSGTGPKAGGPNYLQRFVTERVRTTDITATGGNHALLSQTTL